MDWSYSTFDIWLLHHEDLFLEYLSSYKIFYETFVERVVNWITEFYTLTITNVITGPLLRS